MLLFLQKPNKMAFEVCDVIGVIIFQTHTVSGYISFGYYF